MDAGYKIPAIAKELIDKGIMTVLPYTRPKEEEMIKNLSIQNNTNMMKQTTATYVRKTKYFSTQEYTEKSTEYIKARKVYVKTVHL